MSSDWTYLCIQEMAKKAIENHKVFEYMLFWMKESIGWQRIAKSCLQKELSF